MIVRKIACCAGMLIAFAALLRPQDALGAGRSSKPAFPSIDCGSHSSDALLRQAEAAFEKASVLRRRQTEEDLRAALVLLQKSSCIFQGARLNAKAAAAELQAGEIHFMLSEYMQALSSYHRALALAGKDPELKTLTLAHMARTCANNGQAAEAESYSSQAVVLSEGLSSKTRAEAQQARGETLLYSDRAKAAEAFIRARDLFAEAHDSDGEAGSLLKLAEVRAQDGNLAEGLQLAAHSFQLWSSAADAYGMAQARKFLGILAGVSDQFETAQCNYIQVLPVFHAIGDKDNEAIMLNIMGRVARETGDADASLIDYRRARAVFAQADDRLGEVEAITGMGMALEAIHQFQDLLPLYKAKLRLAQQAGNRVLQASALADLAGAHQRERRYAQAEPLYLRALDTYHSANHPRGEGDVLIRLAGMQTEQGRYSEAVSSLNRALPLKEETNQIEDVARIHYELAADFRRLNRLEDALAEIEKTIAIIEQQRLTISKFDSRASYFASVHRYYALYVQVLMQLDAQNPGRGYAQQAFEASERSKVRSLLDLLANSSQNSSCDALLKQQLLSAQARGAQTSGSAGAAQPSPVLSLPQVQAEIQGDDVVLLEYALGDDKSYVWAVDQGHIRSYELPPAEQIGKAVQDFREALMARQPRPGAAPSQYLARVRKADQDYQRTAQKLSRLLLGPVLLPPGKRLVIVPDGLLQYVPFSALPMLDPAHANEPLLTGYDVTILPSASALSSIRKAAASRPEATAVAAIFADPVFERDDPRLAAHERAMGKSGIRSASSTKRNPAKYPTALSAALRDVQSSGYIARLPGSRDEAEAIEQAVGKRNVLVALDFQASRDNLFKSSLDRYRFVHFATHGIIDALHPEMSGLVLSLVDETGKPQNGYLRLGDIDRLHLSADLVVLSACDSALGKDLKSEGIIGLPREFLHAGAHRVIASLWKVDDEATAKLMRSLYERMQKGESPSSALRGAQLELARDPRWSKPYYWASFVLQGDYK